MAQTSFCVVLGYYTENKMLQRIRIENFKSLKNVTLDLQRVNVLIGPNNSGKTNVLKALELSLNSNKLSTLNQDQKSRLLYNLDFNNIPKILIKFTYKIWRSVK